jgi:hypothetical protein
MNTLHPVQIALRPAGKSRHNVGGRPRSAFAALRAAFVRKRCGWTMILRAIQQETERIHE